MVEFVFDGVLGLGEIWCKVFVFYFGLVWLLCKVIVDDIVEVLGFGLKFVGEVVVVLFQDKLVEVINIVIGEVVDVNGLDVGR